MDTCFAILRDAIRHPKKYSVAGKCQICSHAVSDVCLRCSSRNDMILLNKEKYRRENIDKDTTRNMSIMNHFLVDTKKDPIQRCQRHLHNDEDWFEYHYGQ